MLRHLVVLLLSTCTSTAIQVRPPRAAATAGTPRTLALVVQLDATGAVVAGKRIDDSALDALLRAAAARDPSTQIVFRYAPDLPHARVVQALELAKRAGCIRLALATH